MTAYSPAQAAARSGFTLHTLRYYEREGILPPVARDSVGRRVYSDDDLATLGFLRCLRDTGMPIELLRRYGELCQDPGTVPERIALLREHAAAVEAQIAQLQRWRVRIGDKLAWYADQADGTSAAEE
ncbi:MerR family transcriptional regulator [Solwaraspora sp. WMMD406]|uniref:MerR family transcriptional regulator n=1 Tax=Solwaraspora sp. WMMD406 TaxID=3016095 RepID=UPI002417FA86|nr:MerR family transcriptional regulator [Solwaraspora sp. WMMD406]MDG4768402.1 MerR family transcriptional regulator [Solwaraspora sp. WMMD406]